MKINPRFCLPEIESLRNVYSTYIVNFVHLEPIRFNTWPNSLSTEFQSQLDDLLLERSSHSALIAKRDRNWSETC